MSRILNQWLLTVSSLLLFLLQLPQFRPSLVLIQNGSVQFPNKRHYLLLSRKYIHSQSYQSNFLKENQVTLFFCLKILKIVLHLAYLMDISLDITTMGLHLLPYILTRLIVLCELTEWILFLLSPKNEVQFFNMAQRPLQSLVFHYLTSSNHTKLPIFLVRRSTKLLYLCMVYTYIELLLICLICITQVQFTSAKPGKTSLILYKLFFRRVILHSCHASLY